ncbi:MAG: ABC transporter permease [Candidatus Acidiferrum sp.]
MGSFSAANRMMFWRILRRLLAANPGRLFVILLALGSGAATTAALLNLQVDAKQRLTTEFRAFGANIIMAPSNSDPSAAGATLDESLLARIPPWAGGQQVSADSLLYLISSARAATLNKSVRIVTVGRKVEILPAPSVPVAMSSSPEDVTCDVGTRVAAQLNVQSGDRLALDSGVRQLTCLVQKMSSAGGTEDSQIFLPLNSAQRLAALPGRISVVRLTVSGKPAEIEAYISSFAQKFPGADVHGIRQFTEAEGKLYNRISGLLTATVLIILVLTFFCVMAAMTNVAMERRNDVGLMKSLGGSVRRIVRLFLAEAALLGLAGGLIGSTVGILLSIWLGKAVFGVAARPRLIVYPVAVMLTLLVSLASALPLRRLASIRPASVFRGEA